MAFNPINTQEELDAVIKDRLERERSKYSDYNDLKKQVETLTASKQSLEASLSEEKTQSANLQKSLEEATGKIHGHELKAWRMSAAISAGIPMEMADRISGEDEESIKSDAEALAKFFKQASGHAPLRSIDPDGIDEKEVALKSLLKNL